MHARVHMHAHTWEYVQAGLAAEYMYTHLVVAAGNSIDVLRTIIHIQYRVQSAPRGRHPHNSHLHGLGRLQDTVCLGPGKAGGGCEEGARSGRTEGVIEVGFRHWQPPAACEPQCSSIPGPGSKRVKPPRSQGCSQRPSLPKKPHLHSRQWVHTCHSLEHDLLHVRGQPYNVAARRPLQPFAGLQEMRSGEYLCPPTHVAAPFNVLVEKGCVPLSLARPPTAKRTQGSKQS